MTIVTYNILRACGCSQYIIGNNGHVDTSASSPQYIIGNNGHVDTSASSPQYIIGNNGHVDTSTIVTYNILRAWG
jgi:hypothetical protein